MSTKNMVIMVTGGSGLVGNGKAIKQVTAENPRSNEKFIFLSTEDGYLMDPIATKIIFETHRPTHVIHLAAKVGGLFDNMKNNIDYLRTILIIDTNILQNSYMFGVKKVIGCLSTCIFPDAITYPMNEFMIHNGPPNPTNFGYSNAKRMLDVQNMAYNEQYGCNFTSVIPTNVFGPHDNYSLKDNHVIPGLIHKAYLSKKEGKPLFVLGSGKPLRQFIYSEDLAKLILWVLREYEENSPIVLSVDEADEISIIEVAQMIADVFQLEHGIILDENKAIGQFRKTVSNQKLRQYLPSFQFTPLLEALKKTIDWFIQNYDISRK